VESLPPGRLRGEPPRGPHAPARVRRREPAPVLGDVRRAGRAARPAVVPWPSRPGVRKRPRRSLGRREPPLGEPVPDRGVWRLDPARDPRARPPPVRRDDGTGRRGAVRLVPHDALLRPPRHGRPCDVHLRRLVPARLGARRPERSRPGRSSRGAPGHPGGPQQGERRPPALRPRRSLACAIPTAAPRPARPRGGPRGHGRARRVAALALPGGEPVDGGAECRRRRHRVSRSHRAQPRSRRGLVPGMVDTPPRPPRARRNARRARAPGPAGPLPRRRGASSPGLPRGDGHLLVSPLHPVCGRTGGDPRGAGAGGARGLGPPPASAFRQAARVERSWVRPPPSPWFQP